MMIIIAIISIFAITGLIWLLNKVLPFRVCPVCAGVSGTWLWMLVGMYFGQLPTADYQLPVAILLGGSIIGIAYQLEKKVRDGKILAWKILFIPTGFALAYNLIYFFWISVMLLLAVVAAISFFFLKWPAKSEHDGNKENRIESIEGEMKDCC